jgi:Peptidase family M23
LKSPTYFKDPTMKRAWLPLVLVLIGTGGLATADEVDDRRQPVDVARGYVDAFLRGDGQTLLDHAAQPLKKLMKDVPSIAVMRDQSVGDGAQSTDEEISVTYNRRVKSAGGQAFTIMAQVAPDGQLVAFSVQPAGEAPSKVLKYQKDVAANDRRLPVDVARDYVDAFLAGDMQTLLDHAAQPLKKLTKDAATMAAMRDQSVGDGAESANEEISVTCNRLVKSAGGQAFAIMAQVAPDGQLVAFSVQPAGEAPSKFLKYQTNAKLRLPFDGTWTVVWGGRTLKQNYHAVSAGQRFAYDILKMRDGASHTRDGGKNEHYYCFGRPILAPGAGRVVTALDGIADNVPGQMNPSEPCGNHVILDLGHDEFLFLAHLKNGSVKIKPGDRVAAGQKLGLCGNSGNSSEPHLHIHMQTTPRLADGKGLPLQFQHYQANGQSVDRGEPTKDQEIAVMTGQESKPEADTSSDAESDKLAKVRRRLVGRYQLAPTFIFDVRDVNGCLMVGITNQETQEVFSDSPTRWSYRGIEASLEFDLPKTGPAKSLSLLQNGIKQTARRIK